MADRNSQAGSSPSLNSQLQGVKREVVNSLPTSLSWSMPSEPTHEPSDILLMTFSAKAREKFSSMVRFSA